MYSPRARHPADTACQRHMPDSTPRFRTDLACWQVWHGRSSSRPTIRQRGGPGTWLLHPFVSKVATWYSLVRSGQGPLHTERTLGQTGPPGSPSITSGRGRAILSRRRRHRRNLSRSLRSHASRAGATRSSLPSHRERTLMRFEMVPLSTRGPSGFGIGLRLRASNRAIFGKRRESYLLWPINPLGATSPQRRSLLECKGRLWVRGPGPVRRYASQSRPVVFACQRAARAGPVP